MKRLIAALLCVLLMVQMVPVVSAENVAKAQFENATAQQGETVSVKLTLQDCPAVASIAVMPNYDTNVLELISGTWLVTGTMTENWSPEFNDAVITFERDTVLNQAVFEMVFRVRDDAAVKTVANVSCDLYVQQSSDYGMLPIDVDVIDGSVTVICLHNEKVEVPEQAPFCLVAGNNRYYTCGCGAVLKADGVTETTVEAETIPALQHDWDDATCTAPKTCMRPGCGATEGASLGHLWTEKIENDAHLKDQATNCAEFNTYWFDCARCDAISNTEYFTSNTAGPHIHTERIEDAAHQVPGTGLSCQDAKEFYFDCAYCDHVGQESFVSDLMGSHRMSAQWTTENDKHFHKCTVENCDYIEDEQACYGGTATCLEKAVCQECQKAYGTLGNHTLTHHARNEADHFASGNIEYWTCDICDKYFSDASAANEITEKDTVIQQIPHSHSKDWSKNDAQHWNECSCGDKINVYDHEYDHNCDTTCNTCGYVRTITHTWKESLTYNAEQHWTECSVCGEKKDVEDHHGGTATCLSKAQCADCKQAYGELAECDLTGEKAEATYLKNEATCKTAAEYYKSCKTCGKAGTETFFYGNPDSNNHVGGTEVRDAADATCTTDGYTGDTYCKGCDAKLETGTVIPAAHTMNKVDAVPATHEAGGNIEYYTCSVCGKLFADEKGNKELTADEVLIPKEEHAYSESYTADKNGHWNECACGDKANVASHTDADTDGKCDVCQYNVGTPGGSTGGDEPTNTPQTGDNSMIYLWVILLCVSALGIVATITISKKKSVR